MCSQNQNGKQLLIVQIKGAVNDFETGEITTTQAKFVAITTKVLTKEIYINENYRYKITRVKECDCQIGRNVSNQKR